MFRWEVLDGPQLPVADVLELQDGRVNVRTLCSVL